MNEDTQLIVDTTRRILADHCTPEVVDAAEKGVFPAKLWASLEQAGLTLAGIPEQLGGSGGHREYALSTIRQAAMVGAPIPLAETFIAASLMQVVGAGVGPGPVTVASGSFTLDGELNLSGSAQNVAFAQWCDTVVFLAKQNSGWVLCKAELDQFTIEPTSNIAGEPRDSIVAQFQIPAGQVFPVEEDLGQQLMMLGALTRSVMMAGALESSLEIAVEYSLVRKQFGRPIAAFQAVQQQLALLAGEVAASILAADALTSKAEALSEQEVAIAKARIGESCKLGTEISHQVLGAIGYTMEHHLNHCTRRLWVWRDEYGNERYWQQRLGEIILARPADELWQLITATD